MCVFKFHFSFDFTSLQPGGTELFVLCSAFLVDLFSFFLVEVLAEKLGKSAWFAFFSEGI